MFSALLSENLALLPLLPWKWIVCAAVIAYFAGGVWYGVFFRSRYMDLIENKEEKTNWTAMAVQFLGLLTLSYLIGIFSLFENMFLIAVDALIGIVVFMTLAGVLFQRGNTKEAVRFWFITAGYELTAIVIITAVMWFGVLS